MYVYIYLYIKLYITFEYKFALRRLRRLRCLRCLLCPRYTPLHDLTHRYMNVT